MLDGILITITYEFYNAATQVARKALVDGLPKDIGDQLVVLADNAIAATRKPADGGFVLDSNR